MKTYSDGGNKQLSRYKYHRANDRANSENTPKKEQKAFEEIFVTAVHMDTMDSLLVEKRLKKKRKLSPDTQGDQNQL